MSERGSIEKQARRALRRLIFYRLLGEVFALPQYLCQAVIAVLTWLTRYFNRLETAIFCLEQDAARRYMLLTDFDLGIATSEPGRYASVNQDNAEAVRQAFMRAQGLDES